MDDRIVSSGFREGDDEQEQSLRPKTLREYIGQESVKQNLHISIEAALKRRESLDHILLYGPPGLGKTTLAGIIAAEMGQNIRITSGPAIERPGDLASISDQSGGRRRTVHRRDPPAEPFRGGSALPGHGGLCAGHHHRQRPHGPDASVWICRTLRWSAPPPGPGSF